MRRQQRLQPPRRTIAAVLFLTLSFLRPFGVTGTGLFGFSVPRGPKSRIHAKKDGSLLLVEHRSGELRPIDDIAWPDRIGASEALRSDAVQGPEHREQEFAALDRLDFGAFDPEASIALAPGLAVLVRRLVANDQTDVAAELFAEIGVKFSIFVAASTTCA